MHTAHFSGENRVENENFQLHIKLLTDVHWLKQRKLLYRDQAIQYRYHIKYGYKNSKTSRALTSQESKKCTSLERSQTTWELQNYDINKQVKWELKGAKIKTLYTMPHLRISTFLGSWVTVQNLSSLLQSWDDEIRIIRNNKRKGCLTLPHQTVAKPFEARLFLDAETIPLNTTGNLSM